MSKKPTLEQQEYWDNILHDHRLGMGRGKSAKIEYVGGDEGVRSAERKMFSKNAGRVKPKGGAE